jgi:hypothetical protein
MKKILLTLLITFLCAHLATADGWRKGEMQVRVDLEKGTTLQKLHQLNLNGDFYSHHAILFVVPAEREKLEKEGIDYVIEIDDLNERFADFWDTKDAYHSYQEIVDLADSLAANFPDICKKYLYGESLGGRELGALKISDNVNDDENEAEIMFDGGIHGDEIGGPENCIRFARELCLEYGSDPDISFLIDNREIWIYYMVNPDGRVNMSRYNNNGVDLNRDFGYMWDEWGGSSGAYSQVETKALRKCMYSNQFVVHTTYHSGTEYISCPWSYRPDPPPDADHILQLAGVYSSLSGYADLEYGQGNTGMYAINGSTKDGNYGVMGAISWSMEISNSKQPPASQIMQYYNWNKPSMLAMIEYAGYGLEGTVTDSISGDPVAGVVFVNDYLPAYTDSTAGDYHKYVLAGTYDITVKANGYRTKTITGVTVQDLESTVTDFQLAPLDTARQYVYRFPASQIEDNNEADEGATWAAIGEPDFVNYSLGQGGWAVLDMQSPILNKPGPDIQVWEGDFSPEGFELYAGQTMDGPWTFLGDGDGTTEFELDMAGLAEVRFLKIVDDGDGPASANDAGFDLDAISDMEHIWGVYLVMPGYYIDDAGGNGNGLIDPGETVDLIVTISNTGNVDSDNTVGELSTTCSFVTIDEGTYNFGTIPQGEEATGTFTITADAGTPAAELAEFTLDMTANNGLYMNSFGMQFYIGRFPILIVDLDQNHNSGTVIASAIQDLDVEFDITGSFPANLDIYQCVFICLGIHGNNTVLSGSQGQALASFLNHSGCLYMEGGDTWAYDDPTTVHAMFNINGLNDGGNDLGLLLGQSGGFMAGMNYNYGGDNAYIDRLEAISPAFELFRNQVPSYCNAVAYDAGTYKTIGSSFEFGGMNDGQNTKVEYMEQILEFFGGLLTDIEELDAGQNIRSHAVYPNPFNNTTHIGFIIEKDQKVKLEIYDLSGQLIQTLLDLHMEAGQHQVAWNVSAEAPAGIYLYKLQAGEEMVNGKLVLLK